jgi:hypothetical protein
MLQVITAFQNILFSVEEGRPRLPPHQRHALIHSEKPKSDK